MSSSSLFASFMAARAVRAACEPSSISSLGSLGCEGTLELVDWYIWAACTPLVIGLAKRFPLTGPRLARHIVLHTIVSLMMAPLASVTQYFLSLGLLRSVFHITGPDVHHFLSSFGVGVLFMSFTGILTYWL